MSQQRGVFLIEFLVHGCQQLPALHGSLREKRAPQILHLRTGNRQRDRFRRRFRLPLGRWLSRSSRRRDDLASEIQVLANLRERLLVDRFRQVAVTAGVARPLFIAFHVAGG